MKIHEYQAKEIFRKHGIRVPSGKAVRTAESAGKTAAKLNAPVVVKAQVHAGGRGKAGGVKQAETPEEAVAAAKQILGMRIQELKVKRVLVEQALPISREYYVSFIPDRKTRKTTGVASSEGGVEIEEVAAQAPGKIHRFSVDPAYGLRDYQIRALCENLSFSGETAKEFAEILRKLYEAYVTNDCLLAEINPLVLTENGQLYAADAKVDLDENSLFRHPDFLSLRETSEENPLEIKAQKQKIPYVHLPGNVGILGNGAGLVMTTLDMVSREGGSPANFLDVGGGSNWEVVKKSLELVLLDKKVKGIFVNIFGGISRCDEVARGILEADKELKIQIPVVVRLAGTNVEEGRALLAHSRFVPVGSMEEGARKIVALINGSSGRK